MTLSAEQVELLAIKNARISVAVYAGKVDPYASLDEAMKITDDLETGDFIKVMLRTGPLVDAQWSPNPVKVQHNLYLMGHVEVDVSALPLV